MKFKNLVILILIFGNSPVIRAQYFSTVVYNPGYAGTFPQDITGFQGALFFSALVDTFGTQLGYFNTDQNYGGIVLNPQFSSNPQGFTAFNGSLYFQASGAATGAQVWYTVRQILVLKCSMMFLPAQSAHSPIVSLYAIRCCFLWQMTVRSHGYELWVTDGDSANTHLVKDILPGRSGSNPSYLTVLNNKLYFQANDSAHGPELWVSDGTAAGTQMLQDINAADTTGSFPAYLTVYNNKIYFQANNGVNGIVLWSTDGTQTGTQLVSASAALPQNFTLFNNSLYFQAFDTIHGAELWVTNGTSAGTQLVSDIYVGTGSSNPQNFMVYGNNLYFQADDSVHGPELWVMNTSQATSLVSDINPGPTGSYPEYPIVFDNKLFFVANDSSYGWEMFSYTTGADTPVLIVPSDSAYSSPLSATGGFTIFDGVLAFSAEYDSSGQELWFYGPQILAIKDIGAGENINVFPNPFSGGFNLSGLAAGGNYTITLVDISGRQILQQHIQAGGGNYYIASPALASGVYLLQIQSGENFICRKLVKTSAE